MKKINKKKGLSEVVATVLLIFVGIAAIGLIAGVLFPMVKKNLETGKGCFELKEYFKISSSSFTCYNENETRMMIERGMDDFKVKGIATSIVSEGASKRYDVVKGNVPGVWMWNKTDYVNKTEIPNPGEARSYSFNIGNGKSAGISAVQENNNVCEPVFYAIPSCSDVL